MEKVIHYCWFGEKKLSKLAENCIKSWKKYLPDYKIIRWDETNCDINECPFAQEAYQLKKWAFVADYFRTKVLNEYGGIYFDTDMELVKDISSLLKEKTILGYEDFKNIAAGFWYEPKKNGFITRELLKYYRSQLHFDKNKIYSYSIPKLITEILIDRHLALNFDTVCDLKDITIYPREYFYPISYNGQDNIFTDNTYMIHHYAASWVPKEAQKERKLIIKYGNVKAKKIIERRKKKNKILKKTIKIFFYPAYKYYKHKKQIKVMNEKKYDFEKNLTKIKTNDVLVIYNPNWLGTSNAVKELFDNYIGIGSLTEDEINYFAENLIKTKSKLIIFNAFEISWGNLIKEIKKLNPNQKIKILWHGSNAVNIDEYDWHVLQTIFDLLNKKFIESIGFVKKSLYEFYKSKGYKVEFVMNNVNIKKSISVKQQNEGIRIGIYASGDRWLKNFYNQLSAASMIKNHLIDCIPISQKTKDFAKLIKANLIGKEFTISREQLLDRLAKNDINLYVTFVECAPLLPLESFEMGVPCITSNNHHYWENTELEKYLIVNAPDNIVEIKNKIEYVLKNKEKIMNLYEEWKKEYNIEAKKSLKNFIK